MIETRRLILRPMTEADIPAIALGLNNLNVSRNTGRIPYPYAESDAAEFLEWHRTLGEDSITCCVDIKDGKRATGMFSVQRLDGDAAPELGYWLAEDVWRQGYGFEAALALTTHAFKVMAHAKLVASYHIGNEASMRILKRLGFRFTGYGMGPCKAQGVDVPIAKLELLAADSPLTRS